MSNVRHCCLTLPPFCFPKALRRESFARSLTQNSSSLGDNEGPVSIPPRWRVPSISRTNHGPGDLTPRKPVCPKWREACAHQTTNP
ncbi:hypothetical protein LZ30DRAFT_245760 [Colletotrichum cereale]|nr:hypothetical protein LZ30DRAFT_245760 [Colletotrichum cereale]